MVRSRNGLALRVIAEQFSIVPVKQSADRRAQFENPRRNLLVQSFLIVHRRQKPDRDHDESSILRRPQRHREAVDVRAPQPAGDDIALLAQ